MGRIRRLVAIAAVVILPVALATPASASRRGVTSGSRRLAAVTAYTVGVDNGSPAGHNFQYTDFFPNTLTAHAGDTIDFAWNTGSADGFHTVTLFAPNDSSANYPLTVADPEGGRELNPAILAPSSLPCGAGACTYTGAASATVSSGAIPTVAGPTGAHLVVTLGAGLANGTVIQYACLIHPTRMKGTITITTGTAETLAAAAAQAATQYTASTTAGLAAETAANTTTSTTNANGSKTWTATAGTSSPVTNPDHPVEVLEMLPANLPIKAGDTVKWTDASAVNTEIHTVTFPDAATVADSGPVNATNPIPFLCDGATDTPAPGGAPPNFGCTAPAENAFFPQAQGATAIATGTTVGSSGLLSNPAIPNVFPNTYSFTFPKNGTFSYMCHIHAHMFGTVFTPGYRSVASDGGIFTHGGTDFFGSEGGKVLNQPVVGMTGTPDQQGYYEVATDGGIFTFGDAKFMGSKGGSHLNKPVVGMAVTPDGGGYYLVASDGGIFTYGDAQFHGSEGGSHLNAPIVGMTVTPDGGGYYLVASDGGIFTHGDASFQGSKGGTHLNAPIVGMAATSDGGGYYLVASDGGIFTYGTAVFFGSEGGKVLNMPVVGMQVTTDDGGYRLVATDGGIFTHGDAGFFGSEGGTPLTKPVVGITGS